MATQPLHINNTYIKVLISLILFLLQHIEQ